MFTVLSLIAEDFPVTKTHVIGNPFSASDIYVCKDNCSGFELYNLKYCILEINEIDDFFKYIHTSFQIT